MLLTTEGKKELTKESLLKEITELDLWRYYTDTEVRHGKHIKGDPSAVFYIKTDGTILLKDFAKSTSNIWTYLMNRYECSFREILERIANDFELDFTYKKERSSMPMYATVSEKQSEIKESVTASIRIMRKPLSLIGAAYWQQYGISPVHLEEDLMYELDHYWLIRSDNTYKFNWSEKNPIFCKDFSQQLKIPHKYKIYKPLANKDEKHFQNIESNVLYGEDTLEALGGLLIITKSYKDWRVLKNLGYSVVGFQGESSTPKPVKITNFRNWFNKVVVFFDNDEPGCQAARKLGYFYGLKNIMIPIDSGVKDPSDYYKEYGHDKTKELCQSLIKEIL